MHKVIIRLGLVLIAQAAPLSVSELLADPDRFYGQPVVVSGTISNIRESLRRTPIYTFDLSDGIQTVFVMTFRKPPCQSGAVTVEGTFETTNRRMKASYAYEKIFAHNMTCLPDRGPKGK